MNKTKRTLVIAALVMGLGYCGFMGLDWFARRTFQNVVQSAITTVVPKG